MHAFASMSDGVFQKHCGAVKQTSPLAWAVMVLTLSVAAGPAAAAVHLDTDFNAPLFTVGDVHGQGGTSETPQTAPEGSATTEPTTTWYGQVSAGIASSNAGDVVAAGFKGQGLQHTGPVDNISNRDISDLAAINPVYFGAYLRVTTLPTAEQGIAGFSRHNGSDASAALAMRPDPLDPTKFNLGIGFRKADAWDTTQLSVGEWYYVMFDQLSNNPTLPEDMHLWIDPATSDANNPNLTLVDGSGGIVRSLRIGFATTATGSVDNGTFLIDGILVTSTFAEAVQTVPEPASAAVLSGGAILLMVRRRRAQ